MRKASLSCTPCDDAPQRRTFPCPRRARGPGASRFHAVELKNRHHSNKGRESSSRMESVVSPSTTPLFLTRSRCGTASTTILERFAVEAPDRWCWPTWPVLNAPLSTRSTEARDASNPEHRLEAYLCRGPEALDAFCEAVAPFSRFVDSSRWACSRARSRRRPRGRRVVGARWLFGVIGSWRAVARGVRRRGSWPRCRTLLRCR